MAKLSKSANSLLVELRSQSVGHKLRSWRQAAGLTQKEVADALGYTTAQFVSNWERGTAIPPLVVLPRIAKLYRVSPRLVVDTLHDFQRQAMHQELDEIRRMLLEGQPY